MRATTILAAAALALLPAFAAQAAKDTVIIGLQQEPTKLDPTADATASIDTIFTHNVFESLVTVDEQANVLPDLAKSWTVSADGLTYTFRLNEGVTFHDGSTFDSADVLFTFQRAMAEDSTNPTKAIFGSIDSVTAPDAHTVVIAMKKPDAFFLFNMAQGDASIVAPETAATNETNPVGTGPYAFTSWNRGDRMVLTKYAAHRDAANVAIREVTFRFISDAAAASAALLSEEIDAFPGIPAPEMMAQFEADPRFKTVTGSTEGEVILALNNGRKPFDDIRVRRAINHALDRKAIIDGAMYGHGQPIGSFFPPHHASYVDHTGMYPYSIEKAKALLAEAGVADTLEVSLRLPPFPYARRSGEIIQQQLGKAGIKVNIENVEWGFWISDIYKKSDYDMTVIAHTSPNDLGNFARGPKYFYGYDSPEFNALWEKISSETDPAKLDALLKEGQKKVAEDAVHGFLFQLPRLGVYKKDLAGYWTSAPVLFSPLASLAWTN
ncbi:MAG: ABC transporter substrate-binding protein [Pseudomonadota bacterium]|nr:ABC transporter substrate-binding protein [Pseudomonadota bacterium]